MIKDIQLSAHLTANCICHISYLWSMRMQVGQHIGILRTHSRDIIQQIRSRTITGNNLTVHPFQSASGQIYSQPVTAISQFQQLRISTFPRIKFVIMNEIIILIATIYIFTFRCKSGAFKIYPSREAIRIRFSPFFFEINIDFLIPVQRPSFNTQRRVLPTKHFGQGETYIYTTYLCIGKVHTKTWSSPNGFQPHNILVIVGKSCSHHCII